MSRFIHPIVALTLAAATAWVAGCGASSSVQSPSRSLLAAPAAITPTATASDAKGDWMARKQAAHEAFLKALALTPEQRTKVDALIAAAPKVDRSKMRQEFIDVLAKDPPDKAAVEALARKHVEAMDQMAAAKREALAAFREILTPEQRTKAVALILDFVATQRPGSKGPTGAAQAGGGMMMGGRPAGGGKWRHRHHGQRMMKLVAAASSFLLTGDGAALEAAMKPDRTVDERVAGMTGRLLGMSADQRASLLARLRAKAEPRPAAAATAVAQEEQPDSAEVAEIPAPTADQ